MGRIETQNCNPVIPIQLSLVGSSIRLTSLQINGSRWAN
jgi:hypothetical protein